MRARRKLYAPPMNTHDQSDDSASRTQLESLASAALERAATGGAEQAEVAVSRDTGLSVTARLRDIETLEYQADRGLGVTVYVAGSKGSASSGDFSAEALDRAVDKALSIARQTSADPCAGLADAERLCEKPLSIALDFPWALSPEDARELAIASESAALDTDPRIQNSEGAQVSTHRSMRVYANSHGFVGFDQRSRHSISCSVIGADDAGGMERDYEYTLARDPAELVDGLAVGREAATRAVRRLGSRQLSTQRCPVVYSADMARGLLGHAVSAMSGAAQYRKASFLQDAVGERLFPDWLQWHERPHLDRGLGSAAFDNEGVTTVDRHLVADGKFSSYILSSYSARRLGLETTGHAGGLHNVDVLANGHTSDRLLAEVGSGFLVTELMGQGVNMLTGDYSRGAAGYWFEDGEIRFPVSEVTVAGNLRDIYASIRAIGTDRDLRGLIRTGSVWVDGMTVAGS
ncbi:MAG: metalloprotease PmbA [Pseudomonadota bacterium]